MNENEVQDLLDAAWRRRLAAEELALIRRWCEAHPEQQAGIEATLQVSATLHELPDAPVPSNFLSQIWQEVDRAEKAGTAPASSNRGGLRGWRVPMARFAVAACVVGLSVTGWWGYQTAQRGNVAAGLEQLASGGPLPDLGMMRELDAIRVMTEASLIVDVELLAALQ